jgi:hypothetical protein
MAAWMQHGADGTIQKSAVMLEDEQSQTRFEGEWQAPVDALTTAA